jgi:tetratricopeptide (TPR) repeat protein
MIIKHKIDAFLFEIFPDTKGMNEAELERYFCEFYSTGLYKPTVLVEGNLITVDIDEKTISEQTKDYQKVVKLCENGQFSEAKLLLLRLIEENPRESEYYRIYGQILSDEGNQKEAINYLIDALRWDNSNGFALMMIGNIYAKHLKDTQTAITYYEQALNQQPTDIVSLTNIAFTFYQSESYEKALEYINKALAIDATYPNSLLTKALILIKLKLEEEAFNCCIETLKVFDKFPHKPYNKQIYQSAIEEAITLGEHAIEFFVGKICIKSYTDKLQFEGDKEIEIVVSDAISTPAKIEYAHRYKRDKHRVIHKSAYPGVDHLVMHELTHLDFELQAKKANNNFLFIASQLHVDKFRTDHLKMIEKLKKMQVDSESISKFEKSVFDGMNLQLYNTPIDLFIEHQLYEQFPKLRPIQFLSLNGLIKESIKAVTTPTIVELLPSNLLRASKVLSLVNAIQFKALYGVNYIDDFKATRDDVKLAMDFYDEFLEYKQDRHPGEEYEIILHWGKDLEIDEYFELQEEENESREEGLSFADEIERKLNSSEPEIYQKLDQKLFEKYQDNKEIDKAVIMFMIAALAYFKKLSIEQVKLIAFEFATVAELGISVEKENYTIPLISNKTFTGKEFLSWLYVSWALAVPEHLEKMGLKFEKEFELARGLYKNKD